MSILFQIRNLGDVYIIGHNFQEEMCLQSKISKEVKRFIKKTAAIGISEVGVDFNINLNREDPLLVSKQISSRLLTEIQKGFR